MIVDGIEIKIVPIEFRKGKIRFIDVTKLPEELVYVETDNVERLANAISLCSVKL